MTVLLKKVYMKLTREFKLGYIILEPKRKTGKIKYDLLNRANGLHC